MAAKKPGTKATPKSARGATATGKIFTAEERDAIKERAREVKAAAGKADGESDQLAKIAQMPLADRALAKRLHAIIKANAPALSSKTWYGMPAAAFTSRARSLIASRSSA